MTTDHLGSARVITNENGAVSSRRDYTAFGEESITVERHEDLGYTGSGDGVRKGYTGYEKDIESGLDFAQARYYNSVHGRFTSVDPLTASASIRNPQTFNRYSYVLNSPYKYVDPLGLAAESPAADARCNFRCRVNRAIEGTADLSEADKELALFHIRNGTALGYAFLNASETALGRQSAQSSRRQGPNDSLTTSETARQQLKAYEGYSRSFYTDTAGICTVGYGTVVSPGKSCGQISFTQIAKDGTVRTYNGIEDVPLFEVLADDAVTEILEERFLTDLSAREDRVKAGIKVKLNQNQFDALVILRYNLESTPKLYRAINTGDQAGIKREWLNGNKALNPRTGRKEEVRGLTIRRQKEYDLFMSR